ncbi:hypothetical protein [Kitasatospora aureofaciens]|uniref:hypothetical protein n=1 Tax=Kitasatospora aureofaciens TaxID=1894 RepID=UPI0037CC585A
MHVTTPEQGQGLQGSAALRAGHGFPGNAERLDSELARQLLRRVPVDRLDEADQAPAVVDLGAVAGISGLMTSSGAGGRGCPSMSSAGRSGARPWS